MAGGDKSPKGVGGILLFSTVKVHARPVHHQLLEQWFKSDMCGWRPYIQKNNIFLCQNYSVANGSRAMRRYVLVVALLVFLS